MKDKIIVALDTADEAAARKWVRSLKGVLRWFKVGSELYTLRGPGIIQFIKDCGGRVFLDLKFHDIPHTVAGAAHSAARLGVDMFNVHALGGLAMMRSARNALPRGRRPVLLGVTILTSLSEKEVTSELGIGKPLALEVIALASLARRAGLDGVVASPQEVSALKKKFGSSFKVVTPGIRPLWAQRNDQNRLATPREAVSRGADFIVIGRPITGAQDVRGAARRVLEELEGCG